MAKRRRRTTRTTPARVKVSLRLRAEASGHMQAIAERTGWSDGECASFLIGCGWRALEAGALPDVSGVLERVAESYMAAKVAEEARRRAGGASRSAVECVFRPSAVAVSVIPGPARRRKGKGKGDAAAALAERGGVA